MVARTPQKRPWYRDPITATEGRWPEWGWERKKSTKTKEKFPQRKPTQTVWPRQQALGTKTPQRRGPWGDITQAHGWVPRLSAACSQGNVTLSLALGGTYSCGSRKLIERRGKEDPGKKGLQKRGKPVKGCRSTCTDMGKQVEGHSHRR